MFQDMMDRIEDETIRYLFFLQVAGPGGPGPDGDGGGGPLGKPKPRSAIFRGRRGRRRGRRRRGARRRKFRTAPGSAERCGRFHAQHPTQERQGNGRAAIRRRQRCHRREKTGRLREEGRPQRSLPLRQRQKIQEMPRSLDPSGPFRFVRVCRHLARPVGRLSTQVGFHGRNRCRKWPKTDRIRPRNGRKSRLRSLPSHCLAVQGHHRRVRRRAGTDRR